MARIEPPALSSLTYHELVQSLFPRLTGGIRWGLGRTEALLRDAGNPERRFRTVHVAGTNGKGSVAASLANVLTEAGYRTGLYTSPHLCSFRERIRVDGAPVSEEALLQAAAPLWTEIAASGASFFEATTVLAFDVLARARVDVAVVEVGLGGRLDATNVITPDLALITNISFDHAEHLGRTIPEIAAEKAGIIKAGVPVLTTETGAEALSVIRARAADTGAELAVVLPPDAVQSSVAGSRFTSQTVSWGPLALQTPLAGDHQIPNVLLAVAAADRLAQRLPIGAEAVLRGVAGVRWPGRFDVRRTDRTWVFDVAHNEAGVRALAHTMRQFTWPGPIVALVGILGDKDWRRMLPPLFDLSDTVVLTIPPTAPAGRVWDPENAVRAVPAAHASIERNFARALERAQAQTAADGTVLVCGSFHTVADALDLLGWCETRPDFPLQHNSFAG